VFTLRINSGTTNDPNKSNQENAASVRTTDDTFTLVSALHDGEQPSGAGLSSSPQQPPSVAAALVDSQQPVSGVVASSPPSSPSPVDEQPKDGSSAGASAAQDGGTWFSKLVSDLPALKPPPGKKDWDTSSKDQQSTDVTTATPTPPVTVPTTLFKH
jgi:hypothetical protein